MSETIPGTSHAAGDVLIDGGGLSEDRVRLILERRLAAAAGRETAHEVGVAREVGVAVLVCLIGGERFAVPLAAVAAVLPATTPVPVPTAPAGLAGLIVRRGAIVNLIDAAAALGVASRPSLHVLLLRGPVPRLALRVDEAVMVAEAAGMDGIAPDDDGLTATRFLADGARVEVIAVERLVGRLGASKGMATT